MAFFPFSGWKESFFGDMHGQGMDAVEFFTQHAGIRVEVGLTGIDAAKAVPPGPDNPLGEYAMRLTQTGYLIHGTNRPVGVGMRVTHGCIRFHLRQHRETIHHRHH